jgi:hypothetical protein
MIIMWASRQITRNLVYTAAALAVAPLAGCQSGGPKRLASGEPGLSTPLEVGGGSAVASAPVTPVRNVTWVDRHPLFSKPRDYYESAGNNTVVKTATAAVVGVPVGLFGELRQIVVGVPAETRL